MATRTTLSDLRNAIEAINRQVMDERGNGEVANATVLNRVKAAYAKEVEPLIPQLVDIALTKLLNEVSNRKRPRTYMTEGVDLFGDYGGIPRRVSIARGTKKDIAKLSILEADLLLKAHSERPLNPRYERFKRLVDDCRRYMASDHDTLETALERKRRAELLPIN